MVIKTRNRPVISKRILIAIIEIPKIFPNNDCKQAHLFGEYIERIDTIFDLRNIILFDVTIHF